MSAWHTMLNAIYDFDPTARFTPYVGGGLGAAIVSVDMENNGAGVNHAMTWTWASPTRPSWAWGTTSPKTLPSRRTIGSSTPSTLMTPCPAARAAARVTTT